MDAAGFYGKLPSHGDFVSRRLPREFLDVWDSWLQQAVAESKARLGSDWLDAYLNSPIWRFALMPGICGDQAYLGLMMPSIDRVGRYFPLTVAAPLEPGAAVIGYHLLRSPEAGDFGAAVCTLTGASTAATHHGVPASGALFHYLVRAQNRCGENLGLDSAGQPRSGASCLP